MNLREAYSTLELSEGTSLSDAKKKYRELSKKYHPDVNKDPGSEDKFKKINEAYNRIQKGEDDPVDFAASHNPFDPFNGFNPFNRTKPKQYQVTNIVIDTNISFQESVLDQRKKFLLKENQNVNLVMVKANLLLTMDVLIAKARDKLPVCKEI